MATGGRSREKMSDEIFDFVCTACAQVNKTVEAVKYCIECSGYCCQSCTDSHKKFPALMSHNFMEVNQGHQASGKTSRLPEFPTERCSTHKGKVIDMYCEDHDVVGCYLCFAKEHIKSCPESRIHSVPDMIEMLFKKLDCKQTRKCLKDMMAVMDVLSESEDTKLQYLDKAKEEALKNVNKFHEALETILRNLAEASRKEVETAYRRLKEEILQHKCEVTAIHSHLQATNDKLNASEGNRAQQFVCTKIAREQMKEADKEKANHDSQNKTDVQLFFTPNESLMECLKAFQGIGTVENRLPQVTGAVGKKVKPKHDLYTIKGSTEITIKVPDDREKCCSIGCCLTEDNKLLVTDYANMKLKRIDMQSVSVVDYCSLDSRPCGVCCINKDEVAVACMGKNKIQFVSMGSKMVPSRQIKVTHKCYGIALNNDKLYVSDYNDSVHVYNIHGNALQKISQNTAGDNMFRASGQIAFSESGDTIYVSCGYNGVVCLDKSGKYLSTITDSEIDCADGVCVDGRGNMFVAGFNSHNVVQYGENEERRGTVLNKSDGIQNPLSVCFHTGLSRLFVTQNCSDIIRMYELE